jgi:anti-sigma B factor antagonist
MKIEFKQDGDVGILEIIGRLDAYNAPELKIAYDHASKYVANFILDLAECDFVDSTGLGTIVACLKSASQGGGDIRIARLQDKPRMVFDITRAHKIFDIYDDLDAAVLSFRS